MQGTAHAAQKRHRNPDRIPGRRRGRCGPPAGGGKTTLRRCFGNLWWTRRAVQCDRSTAVIQAQWAGLHGASQRARIEAGESISRPTSELPISASEGRPTAVPWALTVRKRPCRNWHRSREGTMRPVNSLMGKAENKHNPPLRPSGDPRWESWRHGTR